MIEIDKDHPADEWIEELRRRFPGEREIDRVLTNKLRRRSGPAYRSIPLERLCAGIESLLRAELHAPFELSEPSWLAGGASKIQMLFKLSWVAPQIGSTETWMVLRMEPAASVVETSRRREFQLLRAFQGIIPVPPVYWLDADAQYLPYPSLIYGFASGVSKPSNVRSGVSGLGTNFGPDLRSVLATQFIEHIRLLHTADFRTMDLPAFEVPEPDPRLAAQWQINWFERVWEEDAIEDSPLMRLAAHWMRENLPMVDQLSIVHGDFRSGNFLFTENDRKISAWLDWELGHIGDRHEDLAWITNSAFGHLAEDGKTFLACGLMSAEELLNAYEAATGLSIIPATLKFYQIFNAYKCVVIDLATCPRIAHGGKSHQDILAGWLSGLSPLVQEGLRAHLNDVI
jgi:aminoglycoside phosphotransferase (APT) family kinase protein